MNEPEYPVAEWVPLLAYGDDAADLNHRIVTDIISHPTELVTETELVYTLTYGGGRTEAEVRDRLDALLDADFLTRLDGDEHAFYGLTDASKQFVVDSRRYRGHEVLKSVYQRLERPDDVRAAYEADRPTHPPADGAYEEREYGDGAWDAPRAAAYRTLTLSLERVADLRFEARLVEGDEGAVLATETFEVESVGDITDDYREMDVNEPRGKIADEESYGIAIEKDGTTWTVQPAKHGEGWYEGSGIERSLYVFTR